jgi:hypothetical protein
LRRGGQESAEIVSFDDQQIESPGTNVVRDFIFQCESIGSGNDRLTTWKKGTPERHGPKGGLEQMFVD